MVGREVLDLGQRMRGGVVEELPDDRQAYALTVSSQRKRARCGGAACTFIVGELGGRLPRPSLAVVQEVLDERDESNGSRFEADAGSVEHPSKATRWSVMLSERQGITGVRVGEVSSVVSETTEFASSRCLLPVITTSAVDPRAPGARREPSATPRACPWSDTAPPARSQGSTHIFETS